MCGMRGDEKCISRTCGKEPKRNQCGRSHETWQADCPQRKKKKKKKDVKRIRSKRRVSHEEVGSQDSRSKGEQISDEDCVRT